jgi:hypothetical protein
MLGIQNQYRNLITTLMEVYSCYKHYFILKVLYGLLINVQHEKKVLILEQQVYNFNGSYLIILRLGLATALPSCGGISRLLGQKYSLNIRQYSSLGDCNT